MARIPRIVIKDEATVYHVISRTALAGFPFDDIEKDFFVDLVKKLSKVYFAEILGFCFMGNHFHLLARMFPKRHFSNEEVKERLSRYYGESRKILPGQIPTFREKFSSLSEFIKEIKQTFSRFYNKRHGRRGFLWGERFKSVIVEKGDSLINCLAYIDLNPVRAGIVERPEQYRWNSIGYHVQRKNKDKFLSLDFGLRDQQRTTEKQRLRKYREFVYESGALERGKGAKINQKIVETERERGYEIGQVERFKYRSRYFTDSGIIGTKEYVRKNFQRFKDIFQSKNEKVPKPIRGLEGIYSLKRLSEV